MTDLYEKDLETQRARAAVLRSCYATDLVLVRVEYPDTPARVSILGGAITPAMADIWRARGATVTEIETFTSTYVPLR